MSLDAMVAEVDAALSRAHHLFSTATNSGSSPAADAGDTVVRAADHTRGAGGLTAAQDAKLTAIPSSDAATVDEAELGQAETSGAQLVIDALTPQITAVKNAVLGIGISHS